MPFRSDNLRLLLPKFWLLWLLFGMLYVITRFPLSAQHQAGKVLGSILYVAGPRRRHIADVNLKLCFPELTDGERERLLKKHFSFYGISIIESFTAWWAKPERFSNRVEYIGLENLHNALKQGKGVLLLGSHFSTIEITGRLLGSKVPFDMVYRPHKNALFETVMRNGRERWNEGRVIDRRDVRGIIRSLKANHVIWYGPDQDYGRKHSVFVPFMGNIAATVTGTSKLAKLSGADVVPYFIERTQNDGYRVVVHPALENFPGESLEEDATRINYLIEQQIRKTPEQYLWTHRRFKTRPEGEVRPY